MRCQDLGVQWITSEECHLTANTIKGYTVGVTTYLSFGFVTIFLITGHRPSQNSLAQLHLYTFLQRVPSNTIQSIDLVVIIIDLKLIKYSICDDLHALLQLTEAVRALLYKQCERGWIYDNDEFCLVLFFRTRFLRISPLFGKFPIPLHTAVLGENDGPLQKNRIHQSPTDQTTALSTRLNYGTNFGADRVRNSLLVGDLCTFPLLSLQNFFPMI